MAIFHFTVKIVGRSKGKSIISASAYLNGDMMKNEETGRISHKHGNNNLLWRLAKDSISNQSAISLGIGTSSICWSKMVYKGLAGS